MAFVHNPEVLILDEPTVGVDPLLRMKIWQYLGEITKSEGATVIVTTHYVEEAKFADRVGFMRHGRYRNKLQLMLQNTGRRESSKTIAKVFQDSSGRYLSEFMPRTGREL